MVLIAPELALSVSSIPIASDHPCYRPRSWPPPADWSVSTKRDGSIASRWGDPVWDFTFWAGQSVKFHFQRKRLDPRNDHILRMIATWTIWWPKSPKGWLTLKARFTRFRRLVEICDEENILASDLGRDRTLLKRVSDKLGKYLNRDLILDLDRLLLAKRSLGFSLLDEGEIRILARSVSEETGSNQTPYIPARIWGYQLFRIHECLEDYSANRESIEACFRYCVDAYATKAGSLSDWYKAKRAHRRIDPPFANRTGSKRIAKLGSLTFDDVVTKFGLAGLFEKWVDRSSVDKGWSVKSLTSYLGMVQFAGLIYVINFTFMRKEEFNSLRCDCLRWVETEFGLVPVVHGETTKTDPDSDARWVTCEDIEVALEPLISIARLRMACVVESGIANYSEEDVKNPRIRTGAYEPWMQTTEERLEYSVATNIPNYLSAYKKYGKLFDLNQLRITEDDLQMALLFSPYLLNDPRYAVGEIWPLAHHQLRRTGAVNMHASGVSDATIQLQLKHLNRMQTAYYGRNFTRLNLSQDTEAMIVQTRYEVVAREFERLTSERYVSPRGQSRKDEIVSFVSRTDFSKLTKAAQCGDVSFRATRLGGCARLGHCDYGGIEAIARCSGGDGGAPCADALFDRTLEQSVRKSLMSIERQLTVEVEGSVRERALAQEAQGLRNYLEVIRQR